MAAFTHAVITFLQADGLDGKATVPLSQVDTSLLVLRRCGATNVQVTKIAR